MCLGVESVALPLTTLREVEIMHELSQWHLQGLRQGSHHVQGRVALTPLEKAHVGPMETGTVCELFLRDAKPEPVLPNDQPEFSLKALVHEAFQCFPGALDFLR